MESNALMRGLNKVCHELEVPIFLTKDYGFLKAYMLVMEPIAKSLDILQAENKAYLGILVPTNRRNREIALALRNCASFLYDLRLLLRHKYFFRIAVALAAQLL